MRNKFEEIMQSLIECFKLNSPRNAYGEVEECMECDCMTPAPKESPRAAEKQSDDNMLLREDKFWSGRDWKGGSD
jgi:hypothetical protein